jgi:hypothetical protein
MIISAKLREIANSERHGLLVIFFAWMVIQAFAFFKFGISTPIDTGLYLENANGILTGDWPSGREFFYTSYSSLLAVLLLFNVKIEAIIIFQIVIGAMAVFAVYKITQIITHGNFIAFLAAILYAGWFEFQEWNLIVYTDALFANGVVIALYLFMIARNPWHQVLVFLLIIFVALLRPPGVGFVVALGCSLIFGSRIFTRGSHLLKAVFITAVLLVGSIVVNVVLAEFVDSFIDSYSKAEIIYPDISLGMAPPDRLVIPDEKQMPIVRLTLFAVSNPVYFLKISALKAALFLGHTKPYYSLLHNLYIGLYLGVAYFFAVWGMRQFPDRRLGIFMLLFTGFQVATVALTSENWDGRFLLPVLPWVFIVAAVGVSGFRQKVWGKIK